MKTAFFIFAALVITFMLSAILLGEYHSALSVIIGFSAGLGFSELLKREII
jgi:hypothetical protein